MKKLFWILTLATIVLCACRKDKVQANGGNSNQAQAIQVDSFPLTIGHSWKYHTESHVVDSTGVSIIDVYSDEYWNIVSDTSINGILSAKISQFDTNYSGTTRLAYTYYANKSDGFYGMAVENSGSSLYLRTPASSARIQSNLLGFVESRYLETDTIQIPDTSLRFLKFPSVINDVWLSYEYNGPTPDIIKRKWVGYNTITTSAGTFNCIKLEMFRDYDSNNLPDSGYPTIYQYFSSKGLIQEEVTDALNFGNGSIDSLHRISKLVQLNF